MVQLLSGRIQHITGTICMSLLSLLVVSEITIVLLRYVFGIGFLSLQNLAAYAFSALVVLGLPYALVREAHVRVDILREHQSPSLKRTIDSIAIILLLIPIFGLTFYAVLPDIRYSWEILEGSKETGGLPGLFLIKTALPVSCVLMIVQGLLILFDKPSAVIEPSSR